LFRPNHQKKDELPPGHLHFLKHPVFADLMESTETVHRSFSEMMEANGEEHLMFGVFEMIKNMGGLARSQESTQVAQGNNKLNIRV
jgi:hypothetical protein